MIRVWDPLVRVFHWSLVAAFAVAWLSAEEVQPLHEWAGYVVAALIAVRVVWGVVGSRYARFSQFVCGPGKVVDYLRAMLGGHEPRYIGHNPAGAAMILAILITLSGTAFTGWLMEEDAERQAVISALPQIVAPAYADEERSGERGERGENGEGPDGPLKEVHEVFANLMLLLVGLHVGGVVLASMRHRENLARAMITGEKRAPEPGDIS
ncbi:cytochrome b/b6 domain-containing protein [Actibacterium sp. MT2.3-13A]|uniref:cytochrome b/b6 domain-containing protein n=1 Tax=Actibacterium sp. MT2.3-13A TaxID=2828332 RepID=UPI001BA54222|nr:cytochrome b/b6 domain-containing protein [Actibacterium sp. MT2.3-13A]